MQIGSKIFEILKQRGITQKEFSMKTGIAESTISDWKRKGFNPSAAKLPVICNVLGVSLAELLDDGADSSNSKESIDYSFSLSNDEKNLIELFRSADAGQQKRIYSYVLELMKINSETVQIEQESKPQEKQDDELANKKILCKKLRRLSRLDRIKLDESEHASGLNKHLFKYFDFIGVDKLDYIKKYLEHIQPFMVKEVKTQEKFDNAICVLDEHYRISVCIKLDATKGEEVIVSFHENNKNGVAKREPLKRTDQELYVFPESISSHVVGTDKYTINLFITRGATSLPMTVSARKCDEEGFWVRMSDITRNMIETANSYLQDLYTADLDYSEIEPFYSLQQISFTSYGTDVFSGISLLIDSLLMQMSPLSKQVADAALCIFCSTIELPEITKKELMDTLRERYKVNSVKILPEILRRVELNLI
ncbi:MAG: helix-turn-helix transcriptional regulator [Butyrivibrio sp.]|nr:helix-turn-helix transcriptional regulator [Butyrivibrio sp.]